MKKKVTKKITKKANKKKPLKVFSLTNPTRKEIQQLDAPKEMKQTLLDVLATAGVLGQKAINAGTTEITGHGITCAEGCCSIFKFHREDLGKMTAGDAVYVLERIARDLRQAHAPNTILQTITSPMKVGEPSLVASPEPVSGGLH